MSLLPVVIWIGGLVQARRRVPVTVPGPSLPVPVVPDVAPAVAPAAPSVRFVRNRLVDVPQTQGSTR